jgi:hypothetical protein
MSIMITFDYRKGIAGGSVMVCGFVLGPLHFYILSRGIFVSGEEVPIPFRLISTSKNRAIEEAHVGQLGRRCSMV